MGDPAEPTARTGNEEPNPALSPPGELTEEWATQYKYLLADFENYRKRTDRERESAQARVRGSLLRALLPIYEAFERARETATVPPGGTSDALRRGLDLLEAEWQRFLKEEEVAAVARVGQPFAPEEEEAVAEVRATELFPEGVVAEVVQQGYRFRGGLLRPAKVVVARAATASSEDGVPANGEPSPSGEGQ